MSELEKSIFNLVLAMAKAEADTMEQTNEEYSAPVLFEDEIAEILEQHKGEEILIRFNPEGPIRFRYYNYKHDYNVIETIRDALEKHLPVTVNGTNIIDL